MQLLRDRMKLGLPAFLYDHERDVNREVFTLGAGNDGMYPVQTVNHLVLHLSFVNLIFIPLYSLQGNRPPCTCSTRTVPSVR